MLHAQPLIQRTLALAAEADVTFVGIGDLGPKAPLYEDGFITEAELKALQKAGAVGEIVGWAFDRDGRLIEGITNERVASAPIPSRERSLVVALAMGERKLPGILAAATRRLVNGLITDERTAAALLSSWLTTKSCRRGGAPAAISAAPCGTTLTFTGRALPRMAISRTSKCVRSTPESLAASSEITIAASNSLAAASSRLATLTVSPIAVTPSVPP